MKQTKKTRASAEDLFGKLEDLKSAAQNGAKVLRDFTVEVKDGSGEIVAIIIKTLYVRQKRKI